MRPIASTLALFVGIALGSVAQAQDLSGTYTLEGKVGFMGEPVTSRLTLVRQTPIDGADGPETYDVTRTVTYTDSDKQLGPMRGTATVDTTRRSWTRLKVVYPKAEGAATRLEDAMGDGDSAAWPDLDGTYKIWHKDVEYTTGPRRGDIKNRAGDIKGWVGLPKQDGSIAKSTLSGQRGEGNTETSGEAQELPVSADITVSGPSDAVVLSGQIVQYTPSTGAHLVVLEGPASVVGGGIETTGVGEIKIQAQQGEQGSEVVTLEAIELEVTEITVLETIEIEDALPPHYSRAFGQEGEAEWEPAAQLINTPLKLSIKVSGSKDLTAGTQVEVSATGGVTVAPTRATLQNVSRGQSVIVVSSGNVSDAININELQLDWAYKPNGTEMNTTINSTELRIYTIFKEPVELKRPRYAPERRQGKPLRSKVHFEMACFWAAGRKTNTANDADSICHKLDNHISHLVHWDDLGEFQPKVPHYEEGAEAPYNYSKLRGTITEGKRGVQSLYYPSPRTYDYEKDIKEILQNECARCHTAGDSNTTGLSLTFTDNQADYDTIKNYLNPANNSINSKLLRKPRQKETHLPGAEVSDNSPDAMWTVDHPSFKKVNKWIYQGARFDTGTDKELDWQNFRMNYGWWALENPHHVGGRCNQQASLIADAFGTLGIQAEVWYIERTARGPDTGRPMRRWRISAISGTSWNFHGMAMATLDNGQQWLYDGSGSSPPRRENGELFDMMRVGGTFIREWKPWRYEDGATEMVPANDLPHPDTWVGVPLQPGETAPGFPDITVPTRDR